MKVIIIDDEPMPAKHLRKLIENNCFEIKSVLIENSPVDALKILEEEFFDIIFLDVEMPELNGFELLEEANINYKTKVIFTTSYSQYAIKAFEANATHYLLKMVTKVDLILAVRRAVESISQHKETGVNSRTISIYHDQEYNLLKENEIIRLEASEGYTLVVTKDKKILSSKRLGHYEKKISSKLFFRCHHSHLVNMSEVKKLGKGRSGYVVLSNEDVVPISTAKSDEVAKFLNL